MRALASARAALPDSGRSSFPSHTAASSGVSQRCEACFLLPFPPTSSTLMPGSPVSRIPCPAPPSLYGTGLRRLDLLTKCSPWPGLPHSSVPGHTPCTLLSPTVLTGHCQLSPATGGHREGTEEMEPRVHQSPQGCPGSFSKSSPHPEEGPLQTVLWESTRKAPFMSLGS